jgi:hypothetical protein
MSELDLENKLQPLCTHKYFVVKNIAITSTFLVSFY